MKKTYVMHFLLPIVLMLLSLFYLAEPAFVDGAGQATTATVDSHGANVGAATASSPAVQAAGEAAAAPDRGWALSIEMGEGTVGEAEADAIESAGVLNRLELFEF